MEDMCESAVCTKDAVLKAIFSRVGKSDLSYDSKLFNSQAADDSLLFSSLSNPSPVTRPEENKFETSDPRMVGPRPTITRIAIYVHGQHKTAPLARWVYSFQWRL
eukprot:Gregarina_sp_Poly_1__2105@NODE_1557_length_3854_cov_69_683655_g1027_i0_p3_GENE_NODE_1557_length_3854_cov_69_683655_g1027_i0NODE_1557_length_3854_cov_69_683655_g1027_i0_p3_ORF_typecomplete_len105_score4_52_NODE_1557_length_3854_cov_69_683655_g1027_i033013615